MFHPIRNPLEECNRNGYHSTGVPCENAITTCFWVASWVPFRKSTCNLHVWTPQLAIGIPPGVPFLGPVVETHAKNAAKIVQPLKTHLQNATKMVHPIRGPWQNAAKIVYPTRNQFKNAAKIRHPIRNLCGNAAEIVHPIKNHVKMQPN